MAGILARPDHIFEAAFFSTDDGAVWVNLTDYVELQAGLKMGRRRQTVFDDVAPATFDIFLDNSAGTFNNDRTDSPFYGKVDIDVPVRFRLRYPGVDDGTTRNLLSDAQSASLDATKFTADQGGLDTDTASPPSGQTSDILWTTGVLTQTGIGVMTGNGSAPNRIPDDPPVYVRPNTQYSARAQVKCNAAGTGISFQVSLRIRWFDISGSLISENTSGAVTLTTAYQAITVTATSPADAATVRIGVFNETAVGPSTASIAFTGGDSRNQRNSQGNSVYIPVSANVGDVALAWNRIDNKNLTTIVTPAGWTLQGSWADAKSKTYLYSKVLTAADINTRMQWIQSQRCKQVLLLACYSGVNQTTPIHAMPSPTIQSSLAATHTTPSVTTSVANCWIHQAVFDTSTTTTSWSAPAGETVRAVQYTTGGNSPTGVCTDDGTAHAAGTIAGETFTANVSSRYATMHTLALNPATGTGPGSVAVQAGAWELVQGTLTTWQQGGHWANKFTGRSDAWRETFDGDLVLTEVSATDRQKQLNTISVGAAVYENIRSQSPIAYYKLDESDTGTSTVQEAANSADVSQPTLKQVKFGDGTGSGDNSAALQWGMGTGPGTDGSAALIVSPKDKSNGYGLQATLSNPIAGATAVTLVQWFNSSMANDSSTHVIFRVQDSTNGQNVKVSLDLRGQPATNMQAIAKIASEVSSYTATATQGTNYFDGNTHLLAATFQLSGGQLVSTLYVDGVKKTSATVTCPVSEFPTISLVAIANGVYSSSTVSPYLTAGTFTHAAAFDFALDDSTIADIWNAGSTGFSGDTVDQRIARLCSWEGQGNLELDASATKLDRHMPDSQTLLSANQQAARSEGGIVYVNDDGNIRFRSRLSKENTFTPLISVTADEVDPSSFVKNTDDTLLVNKPVIKRLGTGVTTSMVDQGSVDRHGFFEKDVDTILLADQDAKNYASYVMAFYSKPSPRCDQVVLEGLLLQDWANVLLIDIWQILRISEMPDSEASDTLDLYIEGWEFDIGKDSWKITFDTSMAIPFAILNDAVRGVVGQVVVGW